MSFPITIDSGVSGSEQPGKFATFLHSGNRYQIQFVVNTDTGIATFVAVKSTDIGSTWSRVGTGPTPYNQLPLSYSCVQVGSLIYVVYTDNDSFQLVITAFDMSSDTWGSILASTYPPNGPAPQSGEDNYPLWQVCISSRPSTGDLIVVLSSDTATINDVNHSICCFAVFTISGATWSSWTDLDYLDYSDITTWDMIPCGILTDSTGLTTVFMQQVSRAGPGTLVVNQITATGAFSLYLPLDSPTTINLELWGAGGGGCSGDVPGSGGGGGAYVPGPATITPGNTYNGVVGAGGATGVAGGNTTFTDDSLTFTSPGGSPGAAGFLATPGAGGNGGITGFDGGNGGTTNDDGMGGAQTGGGGGGSALSTGAGTNGADGGPTTGGAGGSGKASGGAGGNDNPFNPPTGGQPGSVPGGGGGGHGGADITTPGGNNGGDGEADISWTPIRNTHACRLYFQQIHSDNSLGTLTEITQGAYPSRAKKVHPIPISFDCAIDASDNIGIVFTGATSTSGLTNIAIGIGTDPASLSFSNVSTSSTVDSCPAICIGSGPTYFCCYLSTGAALNFYKRSNGGSPSLIGTLTIPNNGSYSRLQASLLDTIPEITWGVPSQATAILNSPD